MDKKALTQTLQQLRDELSQAQQVDGETRTLLEGVTDDIDRLLQRGAAQPHDKHEVDSLSSRLSDLLVKFEAEHPRLTVVLSQVTDGLANLGI